MWGAGLQRIPRSRAWIAVVLWMGLITWLSSRPGGAAPASALWAYLSNLAHAPLFGLLALWMALLLPRETRWPRKTGWPRIDLRSAACVLAAVLTFGICDELHQHLVVRRDLSALDLGTDFTAAACTLWVAASAGHAQASELGLAGRLLVSVGLCLGAAAVATAVPRFFPGVGWM